MRPSSRIVRRLIAVVFFLIFGSACGGEPQSHRSPARESKETCPSGPPSANLERQFLSDNLGTASVKSFALKDDSIDTKIETQEWYYVSTTDLEAHMSDVMESLRQVAGCFNTLERASVEIVSPAEEKHDEYGNVLPRGDELVATLHVGLRDLAKFPANYNWHLYSVYAANKYVSMVNVQLRDIWNEEVASEIKLGHFQPGS
jgi:hypothetical protein